MNQRLSLKQRLRLLEVTVRPSVQWALDTIRPTQTSMRRVDTLHHNMLHLMHGRGRPAPDEAPWEFWRRSRSDAVARCCRYEPVAWSREWELKLLSFAGHIARYDQYDERHLIQDVLTWRGVLWWRQKQSEQSHLPPKLQLTHARNNWVSQWELMPDALWCRSRDHLSPEVREAASWKDLAQNAPLWRTLSAELFANDWRRKHS
eukprot:1491472-Amphidinium_carterae.1